MSREIATPTATGLLIDAMLRALGPGQEVCLEAEFLKHLPLAQHGEPVDLHSPLSASEQN